MWPLSAERAVIASVLMALAFGLTACGDKKDASHYSSTGMFNYRTGGDAVQGGK